MATAHELLARNVGSDTPRLEDRKQRYVTHEDALLAILIGFSTSPASVRFDQES